MKERIEKNKENEIVAKSEGKIEKAEELTPLGMAELKYRNRLKEQKELGNKSEISSIEKYIYRASKDLMSFTEKEIEQYCELKVEELERLDPNISPLAIAVFLKTKEFIQSNKEEILEKIRKKKEKEKEEQDYDR